MTDSLNAIEDWAAHLLHRLTAPKRRQMLRTLAQTLRRSQQQRLVAQRNPDGPPFAPRKPQALRAKQGAIRREGKMFQKIRLARHLKASVQGDGAALGYTGRVAKIARIHQYGLRDRVQRNGPLVKYHQRQVLGWTPVELETIRDSLLAHLTYGR